MSLSDEMMDQERGDEPTPTNPLAAVVERLEQQVAQAQEAVEEALHERDEVHAKWRAAEKSVAEAHRTGQAMGEARTQAELKDWKDWAERHSPHGDNCDCPACTFPDDDECKVNGCARDWSTCEAEGCQADDRGGPPAHSDVAREREDAAASAAKRVRDYFARLAGLRPGHETELKTWIKERAAGNHKPSAAGGRSRLTTGPLTFDRDEDGLVTVSMEDKHRIMNASVLPSEAAALGRYLGGAPHDEERELEAERATAAPVKPALPEGATWDMDTLVLANGRRLLKSKSHVSLWSDSWADRGSDPCDYPRTVEEALGVAAVLARAEGEPVR